MSAVEKGRRLRRAGPPLTHALSEKVVSPTLSALRRRVGKQVVNWTPEFMGFGNQFYLWAWAHAHRSETRPHRVLIVERSRYWLPFFPAVRPYLIEKSDVSIWDSPVARQRVIPCPSGVGLGRIQSRTNSARDSSVKPGTSPECSSLQA